MRSNQVSVFDFSVKRIDIVAVLIDLVITDVRYNVAYLQACLRSRHVRFDTRYVNSRWFASFAGEASQLGIAHRKKRKTDGRETAIMLALHILQKMCDDGRGNGVE